MFTKIVSSAALVATLALQAEAHSMMTLPKPNSNINNSPSGTLDGPNVLEVPAGMSFGHGHEKNTEAFTKAWKAQTKYKTIREMIYANFKPDGASTKECGQSAATGPPQALPDYVEYAGGLDSTHWGPCEVWCDDTRVFYDENCAVNYPEKPAKLPYEKAKCAGAKRLQSFWLALHVPDWQAYISCATLSGAGASSGGGAAPAPAPAPAGGSGGNGGNNSGNAPTPAATPAPAPAGGNNSGNNNGNGGAAPAPTPRPNPAPAPAPAPVTNKPSGKCTPKRFRRD